MTKEEKIIATAFTGIMFIDGSDIGLLYEYMEKKVGHGVIDLTLASKKFWEELHKACEQDFIDMISKEQPSLSSNLDEAADDFVWEVMENDEDGISDLCRKLRPSSKISDFYDALAEFFKAGAEWMAKQGFISEGIIYQTPGEDTKIDLNEHIDYLEDCEKVIVNIRKKEENHE